MQQDLKQENDSLKTRLKRQIKINKLQGKQIDNHLRRYQDLLRKYQDYINLTRKTRI